MNTTSNIQWGIIGCGDVCERKAGPALYGVDGSTLLAVMRRNGAKAEDYAQRHGVPHWYDDMDQLLAHPGINTVYVATPDEAHHECTLAALNAGKDVLVEKAMASNSQQCDEMIELAQAKNLTLAVAYYRRGYPSILQAKAILESGVIGTLQRIDINDEFPLSHRLDLMHFFCGEVAEIYYRDEKLPLCSNSFEGKMLYCKHQSGPLCVTPLGWDENLVAESLDLVGDKGRIRILDLKAGLIVTDIEGQKARLEPGPLPATHWGLIDNYVKYKAGQAPLACDGIEGRKSTVILDEIEKLTEPDTRVKVQY